MTLLRNATMSSHAFLKDMYADGFYPDELVRQCEEILRDLCREIEAQQPANLAALYALTHAATERLNDMQDAFAEQESELETGAREAFGADFETIAHAYGFAAADVEELIAPRDW